MKVWISNSTDDLAMEFESNPIYIRACNLVAKRDPLNRWKAWLPYLETLVKSVKKPVVLPELISAAKRLNTRFEERYGKTLDMLKENGATDFSIKDNSVEATIFAGGVRQAKLKAKELLPIFHNTKVDGRTVVITVDL